MAVRRDQVQIDISFITDESRALAKTIDDTKGYLKTIKQAQKEGKVLSGVIDDIAKSSAKVQDLDLDNLNKGQLLNRAKQLQQIITLIPKSAPQYKILNSELQTINTQLLQIRKDSKGVIDAANDIRNRAGRAFSAFGGIVNKALGVFGGISLANITSQVIDYGKRLFQTGVAQDSFARKTATVFEDAQSIVEGFAKQTAEDLGLTEQQYINLATAAGDILVPMRFQREEAAEISSEIVNLSGALSEWTGGQKTAEEVTSTLIKALTGEREELKSLGIVISEEDVKRRLQLKGLEKVTGAAREQARAMATLELITEKSADAQANFAENSDSNARRLARLRARISEVGERLANLLLPAFEKLIEIGASVVEFFGGVADGANRMVNPAESATEAFENQSEKVSDLEKNLNPLLERYDELSTKTNLSAEEQEELRSVIQQVGEIVPTAITEFDKYGRALGISAEKAREFIDAQQLLLQQRNREAIDENTKALSRYEKELAKVNAQLSRRDDDGNIIRITTEFSKTGSATIREIKLTGDEIKRLQDRAADLEKQLKTTGNAVSLLSGTFETDAPKPNKPEGEKTITDPQLTPQEIEKAAQERNKAIEKAFKLQLDTINNSAQVEQLILDRALLQKEISESDHGKRLLEIEREQYEAQLALFDQFNKSKSAEAETARNRIIQINQTLSQQSIAPLEEIGASSLGGVERRDINAELDRIDSEEEQKLSLLREKFVKGLLLEQEYDVLKLEAKQLALEQEIELLRQGTDAEVLEAARRQEELTKVEQQLTETRIKNAEREKEAKKAISDAVIDTTQDALSVGIDLLSQDEAARKKNASFIKAFESGKVIAAGIKEVQDIWATSAQFGPIAGPALATARTFIAAARTTAALRKISKTKFARGGSPKLGTFGGRPHSQGGTRGIFEDGTEIEVEKGENFYILNKNSSRAIRSLSAFNQMGGGVPLMRQGGSVYFQNGGVADINTNPTGISVASASAGGTAPDLSPLLEQVQSLSMAIAAMPRTLKAKVVYDDYQEVEADVSTVRSASSIS